MSPMALDLDDIALEAHPRTPRTKADLDGEVHELTYERRQRPRDPAPPVPEPPDPSVRLHISSDRFTWASLQMRVSLASHPSVSSSQEQDHGGRN